MPTTSRGGTPVLIVDDTPSNLVALEALFEHEPYRLVRARSGPEALTLLAERDFAVVLLDVMMPNMDGYEVATCIRSMERTQNLPIIFVTAYSPPQDEVVRAYALGAVDYLIKPLVPEVLKAKVRIFVDLYIVREEVREHAELLREAAQREHERNLLELRERLEKQSLQEQVDQERRLGEELSRKVAELARIVASSGSTRAKPVVEGEGGPGPQPLTIAIIEDDDDMRQSLQEMLELEGHQVISAARGVPGIELILAQRPQVVLLDIGLPDVDGFDVARQLRKRLGRSVQIIALTGYAQQQDRIRALDVGFDAYLVKPIKPETLTQIMRG